MSPRRRSRYGYRARARGWPTLTTLLAVLVAPLGVAVLLGGLGFLLPAVQGASGTVRLSEPVDVVWQLLMDLDNQPNWRRGLTRVERLPDLDGRPAWREYHGGNTEALRIADARPPLRLVTERVVGQGTPDASWTWELSPDAQGSRLTLTRRVLVERKVARALGVLLGGPRREVDRALADLAARLTAADRSRTTALNR